ncbi:hypothetical protein GCM10027075_12360 [Streptomyces heilongjiangensis]
MVVVTSGAPVAGGGLGMVTGPPGGSCTCPVVSRGTPVCCGGETGGCPGPPAKPGAGGGTDPGGAAGAGGAVGAGGPAGAWPGCGAGGTGWLGPACPGGVAPGAPG